MNSPIISTNWFRLDTFLKRTIFWGSLLTLSGWNYYRNFFNNIPAVLWSLELTLEVFGMLFIGYFFLSKNRRFPRIKFFTIVSLFSLMRYLKIYYVFQYHLPEWTVFNQPDRSVFYIFFTSAAFVFLGYSYSIYEWGLAAREEFKGLIKSRGNRFDHPIRIRSEGKTVRILPQDILFLEAKGEYVNYVTTNQNYMCFQRMKQAEMELSAYGFIRAHRSYIVNPINVKSFSSSELQMANNTVVPVSKTYKEALIADLKH